MKFKGEGVFMEIDDAKLIERLGVRRIGFDLYFIRREAIRIEWEDGQQTDSTQVNCYRAIELPSGQLHLRSRIRTPYELVTEKYSSRVSSPSGFEFGFGGSGPKDLAAGILMDMVNVRSIHWYRRLMGYSNRLKEAAIAPIPKEINEARLYRFEIDWFLNGLLKELTGEGEDDDLFDTL